MSARFGAARDGGSSLDADVPQEAKQRAEDALSNLPPAG